MRQDISKTVVMEFINRFTKQVALTVKMPYLPFLAQKGHYSNLYKKFIEVSAFDCEKELMYGKITWLPQRQNRTVISFPNGVCLDVPYDLNKTDVEIIKHHLEGIKMSIQNY